MKKIILLYSFVLASYFNSYSQSSCQVSTDSTLNDSIVSLAPIGTDILDQSIFNFYFKNITSDTIQLKWKVVQRSIPPPPLWDYSMCDYDSCRDAFMNSPEYTMRKAEPGFKAYLLFHILPKDQSTAVLRIYVYDKKYPLQGDTVTWIIKGVNTSGVNDLNNSLRFAMFPNPASDYILIEGENISLNDAEISLYNAMSQEIMNTKGISNHINIDLSQYKNGIYFLKIRTEQGITSKKIIVNK